MTQIELIGCTSAGKSTLVKRVLETCRQQGIALLLADDFVLRRARLNWIKSHIIRTLGVDVISLFSCMMNLRKYYRYYVFSIRTILRLPIPALEKANLIRNLVKKIGIYEIVRRSRNSQQVVLVDEGTLHAVHNLFVHWSVQPQVGQVAAFTNVVPLPNVLVYLRQPESLLIQRTIRRGHKRLPDQSPEKATCFIQQAVSTFEELIQELKSRGNLQQLRNSPNIMVEAGRENNPLLAKIIQIIQAEMEVAQSEPATRIHA